MWLVSVGETLWIALSIFKVIGVTKSSALHKIFVGITYIRICICS